LHDELSLALNCSKYKLGGSARGHNGLKSLIQSLGSDEFARVRIGIGRPQSKDSEVVAKYVLEQFGEEEMRAIRGLAYQGVLEILKKEAFIL
jgi:peptidyl-tRNA hydrolase, PTH1 family